MIARSLSRRHDRGYFRRRRSFSCIGGADRSTLAICLVHVVERTGPGNCRTRNYFLGARVHWFPRRKAWAGLHLHDSDDFALP